jgi:hypothetical protein
VCVIRLDTGVWKTQPTLDKVCQLLEDHYERPFVEFVDSREDDALIVQVIIHSLWEHSEAARDEVFELMQTFEPEYDSMIEVELFDYAPSYWSLL